MPYEDDLERSAMSSEGAYLSDQTGSFEIVDTATSRGKVMREMVREVPISWCSDSPSPYSLIGNANFTQPFNSAVDVLIESSGMAFVARGGQGGGGGGLLFSVETTNNRLWKVSSRTSLNDPLSSGNISIESSTWYPLTLLSLSTPFEAYIDGKLLGQ